MAIVHDTAKTIQDIFEAVQTNLYEANLKWFIATDINSAIQEAYNIFTALLSPVEKAVEIDKLATPYYHLKTLIADFMYLVGIYNPTLGRWLDGGSPRGRLSYKTNLSSGEPRVFSVLDIHGRIMIRPFPLEASGKLLILYKAIAPTIANDHIPLLPHSVGAQILEFAATADLLEQAREFKKAKLWMDRIYLAPIGGTSLYGQATKEISDLARMDRELVLEPFRYMQHSGELA